MIDEGDYIPLSAVERFAFCHRQAYLFHAERAYADNVYTIEGSLLHEKVTSGDDENRPGVTITRSLQIVSHRLGVRGVADVVEFRDGQAVPVEYKRGKRTRRHCEHAQLCLQALCLEEMLAVSVPVGFVYHGQSRRREAVSIDATLKAMTEKLVGEVRACISGPRAPPAIYGSHCQSCSLNDDCQPRVTASSAPTVAAYLAKVMQ